MTASRGWTFITNHGLILGYICDNPSSTAREIASHVGVTERTTHKIIADLETEGYIERLKQGRRNAYKVDTSLPLRHHTVRQATVSDLLEGLSLNSAHAQDGHSSQALRASTPDRPRR